MADKNKTDDKPGTATLIGKWMRGLVNLARRVRSAGSYQPVLLAGGAAAALAMLWFLGRCEDDYFWSVGAGGLLDSFRQQVFNRDGTLNIALQMFKTTLNIVWLVALLLSLYWFAGKCAPKLVKDLGSHVAESMKPAGGEAAKMVGGFALAGGLVAIPVAYSVAVANANSYAKSSSQVTTTPSGEEAKIAVQMAELRRITDGIKVELARQAEYRPMLEAAKCVKGAASELHEVSGAVAENGKLASATANQTLAYLTLIASHELASGKRMDTLLEQVLAPIALQTTANTDALRRRVMAGGGDPAPVCAQFEGLDPDPKRFGAYMKSLGINIDSQPPHAAGQYCRLIESVCNIGRSPQTQLRRCTGFGIAGLDSGPFVEAEATTPTQ